MKRISHLALALLAFSSATNAAEHTLPAGTIITASFESNAAMKGHRIGGPELLEVKGELKCKIIAYTGLTDDALADNVTGLRQVTSFVGTVTPHFLVCDGGKKSISVAGNILPARTLLGEHAPQEVEFIVAQPLPY